MKKYVKEQSQTAATRSSANKLEFEIKKKIPLGKTLNGQSIVAIPGTASGGVSPD